MPIAHVQASRLEPSTATVVFNTLTKHCVQLSTNGSRAASLKETNIIWTRGIWYFVAVFLAGSVSCYTNTEGENMIIRADTVHISTVAVASGCGYVGVWLTCQMMWSGLSPWLQTSFWVLKRLVSKETFLGEPKAGNEPDWQGMPILKVFNVSNVKVGHTKCSYVCSKASSSRQCYHHWNREIFVRQRPRTT